MKVKKRKNYFQIGIPLLRRPYPNSRNADFALLSDNCGAPACYSGGIYLITPEGDGFNYFQIGDPQKLIVSYDPESKTIKAQADGMYAGEDKYGSEVYESYEYIPSKGFVKQGVKSPYLKIVGKRPEDLFVDEVLRKPLLSHMNSEEFKSLRRSMEMGSVSRVLSGRFVLVTGCTCYICHGNYGAILIDLESNEIWWANYSLGKALAGKTSKFEPDPAKVARIKSALFEQSPYNDMGIGMGEEGNLNFYKYKFSPNRYLRPHQGF